MNRQTDVRFPVFNGYVVRVILSRDMKRTGQRLHVDLAGCVGAFVSSPEQPKRGWLVLGLEPDEATIAHESSHAIRELLRVHGARNDDETFAYHLDFLVGRIHKFLKGRNHVDV
jgi:hypothetical protein